MERETMKPLYMRTTGHRVTDAAGEHEIDSVVIAVDVDNGAATPLMGAAYPVAGLNENTVVSGIWPAGTVPKRLNNLTFDTPAGYTVIELRVIHEDGE